jgi:hypothetical protein
MLSRGGGNCFRLVACTVQLLNCACRINQEVSLMIVGFWPSDSHAKKDNLSRSILGSLNESKQPDPSLGALPSEA